MLYTLAAFAVALGILVVVHELGHYLVARACGVRILRFSVGFGRVLYRRIDKHGTEWALSAIPLGGYVKMLDEREGVVPPELRGQAFNAKPVGQRIAVVAAGPLANLILASLLYAALSMAGVQEPAAVLGAPTANTPAARAGIQSGDTILAIDGDPVATWGDARWLLLRDMTDRSLAELRVRTAQGGEALRRVDFAGTDLGNMEGDILGREGLALASPKPVVRGLMAGGAAAAAGLREGDRILAVGDQQAPSAGDFITAIQAHAGQALTLAIDRAGSRLSIAITPREERLGSEQGGRAVGRIGAQIGGDIALITTRHDPLDALVLGVRRTAEVSWFSLRMMGKMVLGDVSLSNLSGPVTIADYAGQTARMGLEAYITFLALVSVSLGILNLLPIPVLDGGHLLYYLIEIVRGSPPPERWMEVGQRAGFGILMMLMAVALFNDFSRLLT